MLETLPQHTFWSGDRRYLLLHGPDSPLTPWGRVELLEVATGSRSELGRGQGPGWTQRGEALVVRWDVSEEIPGPGKGCP